MILRTTNFQLVIVSEPSSSPGSNIPKWGPQVEKQMPWNMGTLGQSPQPLSSMTVGNVYSEDPGEL